MASVTWPWETGHSNPPIFGEGILEMSLLPRAKKKNFSVAKGIAWLLAGYAHCGLIDELGINILDTPIWIAVDRDIYLILGDSVKLKTMQLETVVSTITLKTP